DRREIWLERERAAECLHHDHGLDRPAARPAIALGKRKPEQAELGILAPQLDTEPDRPLCEAFACRELVAVGHQPLDALAQHPLLFGELEIHALSPQTHKPKIALAMMFFWISFEPP